MQTHFNKSCLPGGELPVRAANEKLAVIFVGPVELYVEGPEDADLLIKAGAEAKRLMEAKAQEAVPAPSGMQDPAPVARVITGSDCWLPLAAGACGDGITGDGEGIACGVAPAGHLRRHERGARPGMGGGTCHWPNLADPETGTEPQHAPVITDSERTCPAVNPVSGVPCNVSGAHDGHRDADGEEWRTDGEPARVGRLVGTIVADSADDSPCPVTGKIIGQVDEETVEVLWGDRQFEENPGPGRYEPIDMLRSVTA